ncbi:PAS domain-containing protein [Kiloniella majae]|uniref:PAS domain-containing protein n=1 Tax=Kiloniella majae TaxID=1938558 RepID=UPI0015C50C4C|nr:PAS domain-containing protein [Kiloniella majae]
MYSKQERLAWDAKNRALYEYWLSIHPDSDTLPGRQHLDPIDIPSLLPNVWLVDVVKDPVRFRFRLFGTAHYGAMDRDCTGMWIDEAFPSFLGSEVYSDYINLIENGVPSYRKGPASFHIPNYKTIERIMLPLAENGTDVNMILALTVYF